MLLPVFRLEAVETVYKDGPEERERDESREPSVSDDGREASQRFFFSVLSPLLPLLLVPLHSRSLVFLGSSKGIGASPAYSVFANQY